MRDEAEAEIAAIFARLQHEVRTGPAISGGAGADQTDRPPLAARSRADQAWAVSAERPLERAPNRRLRGYLFTPMKRALRKLMRWYVEPLAAQQRSFNLAVLGLVDELAERAAADAARLERRIRALEERLGSGRADSNE
jgi:CO/xanthine dehydrogenase Mo-binding subunit